MSSSIAHRGPDGDGVFYDEASGVGLAHRRLAIIDLSPTGNQPMATEDQRAIIVFNGEIYNFGELREELIRDGWRFRGTCDTEVLLNLYMRDGTAMLARLNGIFAFAIWDAEKRELFLARDGLGVKPLYYSVTRLGFIFGSEIKALLNEPSVSNALSPTAIARHLTFLWSPAPETILAGVHKLRPGHAMIIVDGAVSREWRYYDLPYGQDRIVSSETETCQMLRSALSRAVERQMVADVPVGAFLSGGLDSSAIVAYAREHARERLQCFTIGFDDKRATADEGMTADLPYAKRVARHLGVDLHTVMVGPEMTDHLEEMIYHLDEPLGDPAPLNALFICKLARDHRPDCKQVCIAVVVTFDGFPLGYEVFAGNTHDSRTLQTMVATMEARHGVLGRVWITDRGMASADNLAWLRQTGRRYIIGAAKSELKKFGSELARPDAWRTVHEGVEVKLTHHPETDETVILCRSADRRSKEKAMHDKFSRRIEAALERLSARIARSRKRLDPAMVNRQIGRILRQNQRAAARFAIALEPDGCPAGFRLAVACNTAFDHWAQLSEGAYLLRSNIDDWSDQQLWKAYIQLTQAEAAFRIQKDQLNVRPIWHQREDRVQAHILVCFLAFVLWKSLEMWQQRAGLGNSPRTILEELARIQSHDVVLPTATHGRIRLRCVTQPDAAQAALLDRLGIVLPKRMRPPENKLPILAISA